MTARTFAASIAAGAVVASLLAPLSPATAVTDGLVAWYPLEETTGQTVRDASGNGRDAAVVGEATWNDGAGFRFSGGASSSGNAIRLPDNLIADLTEITVSMNVWVDPALSGAHFIYNLGNVAVGNPQSGDGYLFSTSAPYQAKISDFAWAAEQVTNSGQNLPRGQWKHITYTQVGSTATLYSDGVQVAQNTAITHTPADIGDGVTTHNFIGRSAYAADSSFRGVVSDFRIYDRALDATTVAQLGTDSMTSIVDAAAEWVTGAVGALDDVQGDLTLPASTPQGATVTWTSSAPSVISAAGVVTRPDADTTVILTARVTAGSVSRDVELSAFVSASANPDQAAVEAAAEQLVVNNSSDVRGNLYLPSSTVGGVSVTWQSSAPAIIDAEGFVSRPAPGSETEQVTLTATLTRGTGQTQKEIVATVPALPELAEFEAYAFSYFTADTLAGERVYLGASNGNDARNWLALNGGQPILSSTEGTGGIRDPWIIRSPEGDKFFMLATDLSIGSGTSWDASQRSGSKYIEVWESTDLVNWSDQRHIRVSPDNAGNTWAPEAYYDESIGEYVVYWASKLYAEDDPTNSGGQPNRMMYATTRDFHTFSEPQIWQDTGVSRIDSTVIEVDGLYHRFTKDEGRETGCLDIIYEVSPDLRAVTTETSETGDWALVDECIGRDAGLGAIEGPHIIAANPNDVNGPGYYLFVDEFGGRKYIPLFSEELGASASWQEPASYTLPNPAPRHGSIVPITAEEHERLFAAYLPAAESVDPVRVTVALGDEVRLPARATVRFADDSSRALAVEWDDISTMSFTEPGEYAVSGEVTGVALPVEATVVVSEAASDMLLHYDFSLIEGTTVPDQSGLGNDGILQGTGSSVDGNALILPGGGASSTAAYVEMPRGMFDGRDTLTISTWLRNETGSGNYAAMFFGSAGSPPTQYWLLNPANPSGQFKTVITDGSSPGSPWTTERGIAPTNTSRGIPGPVTGSDWQLYTTVIEPTRITGYLDGELVGSVEHSRPVSQFGADLVAYIGRSSYADPYFRGGVRDVRVWDSVVDAADIAALYYDGIGDESIVTDALAADAAALDLGATSVVDDVTLPSRGERGSEIEWISSAPETIAADGTVVRDPETDISVVLTATLRLGGQTVERTFDLVVLADTPQKDLDAIADRFRINVSRTADDITLLPAVDDVTITWSSSAPEALSPAGSVTRGEAERTVTLTARFERAGLVAEREYAVTVMAEDEVSLVSYARSGNTPRTAVLHVAADEGDGEQQLLNNGRAILYPRLGATTMSWPQISRGPDGTFVVTAVDGAPGQWMHVWTSDDLVTFDTENRVRFLTGSLTTSRVVTSWDNATGEYVLEFTASGTAQRYAVRTTDFVEFSDPGEITGEDPESAAAPANGIQASTIGLTAAEWQRVDGRYGRVTSTAVRPFASVTAESGTELTLPEAATVEYSSGSTTQMRVDWNAEDIASIDVSNPGTYTVRGTVAGPEFPERLAERRADPAVTIGDDGWYYFTGSYPMTSPSDPTGYDRVILRRSETLAGLADAPEATIWDEDTSSELNRYIWAPELHKIGDDWYVLFTAARGGGPFDIRPAMLKFTGEEFSGEATMDPANWTNLGQVRPAAGDTQAFAVFSLDMTYFEHNGRHYVIWAEKPAVGSTLRMAEIDPANPAQLTSQSILLSTPEFAWEKNAGDAINEGAAVIKRDGKIMVAFSAGTVDAAYCVSVLWADENADLMDPESWTKLGYPLLTTEDVPGQFGPGHNSFTVDELGNPVIVYHSRDLSDTSNPGESTDGGLFDPRRHARAALVHWNADGLPYLTMTAEEELAPTLRDVEITVLVEGDSTPVDPDVTATLTPSTPDGAAGWYRQPVTLELAVPVGAGATIEYSFDGAEWMPYTGTVRIADDGAYTVRYRAVVDGEPVDGSSGSVEVRLDRTAPTVSVTSNPVSGESDLGDPVILTAEASDATSGVDRVEYRVNGDEWVEVDGEIRVTDPGISRIQVRAVDVAGTTSAVVERTILVRAPIPAQAELSTTLLVPGGEIAIEARGFAPGERIDIFLLSTPRFLGSVTAGADGAFRHTLRIPADVEAGEHTLRLVGTDSGRVVEIPVTVQGSDGAAPAMPADGAALPRTGVEIDGAAMLALLLMLVGAALVARREIARSGRRVIETD